MKTKLTLIGMMLALAGCGLVGCGSEPVDLGNDRDPALIGASLSDYQGVWVGYAELAEWNDGTADVRIELDAQGNGSLQVGQAPLFGPPVADDAYPRDWEFGAMGPTAMLELISGFSYPIQGAMVESKRIRLETSSSELYREYCALQTPMLVPDLEPERYNCTGFATIGGAGPDAPCTLYAAGDEVVGMVDDCDPLMCMSVCVCDETECYADTRAGLSQTRIDAQLMNDGEELVGSFELPELITGERIHRVVMTRE